MSAIESLGRDLEKAKAIVETQLAELKVEYELLKHKIRKSERLLASYDSAVHALAEIHHSTGQEEVPL